MNTRTTLIVVLLMIVGATLAGVLLWNRLPDPMASHWNINDQVDGYTPKVWGVFMLPLMTLGMLALFLLIPNIDPLKANIAQFREAFNLFITLIVAFMLYIYVLSLRWNLGYTDFGMGRAMLPAMGVLFFFIGIRTPWTLSSDRVWNETHRLGSILFMISGVFAVVGSFFGGPIAFWLFFVPVMGSVLITLVYSYVIYQREVKA